MADLGNAGGGVRWRHHRYPAPLGDGVCRKGLLGEGGPNEGHHTTVDLEGEGRVGGGLVAAAVLQAQGHGFAVDAAAAIDCGKGQVEACALVLAVDIGVASQR